MLPKKKLDEAIANYKPRPENAAPSRKKSQRHADVAAVVIKEKKKNELFRQKQEAEQAKRVKRLETYERLKRVQSSTPSSAAAEKTKGTSQILTVNKEKKKQKKKSERAVIVHVNRASSSSESEEEEEEEEEVILDKEDDDEKEELGVIIPPTPPPPIEVPKKKNIVNTEEKKKQEQQPPEIIKEDIISPLIVVRPNRSKEIMESRSNLPVCRMEQEIIETIKSNPVVFVSGETGSGKTTQIPQMLLEAGFGYENEENKHSGQICVSQPRRVAAISVAERVAFELGLKIYSNLSNNPMRGSRKSLDSLNGCVGYQIRHDANTLSDDCTRIKFCTDGILLRECKQDLLLRKYSVIILDEIHERGMNSDLLIGILSRVIPLRQKLGLNPLKVIIMSATLDLIDFFSLGSLYENAPVIKIEQRQHQVISHFAKRTEQIDYLNATFKKVCQIHSKLPSGSVLVFLPGQREIEWLCYKLREKFNEDDDDNKKPSPPPKRDDVEEEAGEKKLVLLGEEAEEESEDDEKEEEEEEEPVEIIKKPRIESKKTKEIMNKQSEEEEEDVDFSDLSEGDDDNDVEKKEGKKPNKKQSSLSQALGSVNVIPLYSKLPPAKQKKVFEHAQEGVRNIIVATNIAETSVTIPGVRYVVDCGREKRRVYDQNTGTSTFQICWISQASANQRLGRAGRTGPGHCYRLYSAAVYSDIFQTKTPPETNCVPIDDLVLYMKNLGIDKVVDFPLPTRLDKNAVILSVSRLKQLGILNQNDEKVTKLGKYIAQLPCNVRIGKMLIVAKMEQGFNQILEHVVALASMLSLPSPYIQNSKDMEVPALLKLAGAYSHDRTESFCDKHYLNAKIMKEFEQLYRQLTKSLKLSKKNDFLPPLPILNKESESLVYQAVISGLIDKIAKKKVNEDVYESCDSALQMMTLFIHPNSSLKKSDILPEFVAYQSVNETGRMEGCMEVEPTWLRSLCLGTSQCKDVVCTTPEPFYEQGYVYVFVKPTFGSKGWGLPIEKILCHDDADLKVAVPTFARALLEGKVTGKLFDEQLSAIPFAHCTRAQNQPRTANLISALTSQKVCTGHALVTKWRQDQQFLRNELVAWIRQPEDKRNFEKSWPSLIENILRKHEIT